MKPSENLMTYFKKMDKRFKYLIVVCVVVLLISLFYPKSKSVSVKLVPVSGSSYYQAVFEGFSSVDEVANALSNNKPVFVAFVTSWCGYCKALKPIWDEFEKNIKKNKKFDNINVLMIDCDKNKKLSQKHNISGYPTIKYLPNGLNDPSGSIDYDGAQTPEEFNKFLSKYQK
jgi:thiol-disulfide isomerase/thioredoxin